METNGRARPRVLEVGHEPPPLFSPVGQKPPTKLATIAEAVVAKPETKAKAGERFAVVNTFTDMTMKALTRAEMAVWFLLWRDTKPSGLASTSEADLARRAGVNIRTIERAVRKLERCGLLTVAHRGGLRKGLSAYRVHPLTKETPTPP